MNYEVAANIANEATHVAAAKTFEAAMRIATQKMAAFAPRTEICVLHAASRQILFAAATC